SVAGPPSPLILLLPLPTNVVITCVTASARRTRLFEGSDMNRLPALSKATPRGPPFVPPKLALVAGPLSPPKPSTPLPATVAIFPVRRVHAADAIVIFVRD